MKYYIADCHFYHKNLLTKMDNRDFESVEQMNEVMIEKWNKKVHARDEVVILGDLSLGNGKETNEILCRLKGRLCLIRGNHDERYLRDRDFDTSRFEWVKDYAEIHDNKRKIVLMHYPIFCYNGQLRRGADGTSLTYMLHGHIHKTEDQELVDRFAQETRAAVRRSVHQEEALPVPCQMINCFCMYSDYTPLTLEEWVECDQRRMHGDTEKQKEVKLSSALRILLKDEIEKEKKQAEFETLSNAAMNMAKNTGMSVEEAMAVITGAKISASDSKN